MHRVIQFNQKALLKSYIDMKHRAKRKGKNDFEKVFFKLMSIAVFGKTMKNVRKQIYQEARRNYLVSKPNHHITIFFLKIY